MSGSTIKERFRSLFKPRAQSTPTSRSLSLDGGSDPGDTAILSPGQFKATKMWEDLVQHVKSNVEIKRRRHKFRYIDSCVTGSDVTTVVLEFLQRDQDAFSTAVSKENAIKVCQMLLDKNILKSATEKSGTTKPFEDCNSRLYQFVVDVSTTPEENVSRTLSLQMPSTSSAHLKKSSLSKKNSAGAIYHRMAVGVQPVVGIPSLPCMSGRVCDDGEQEEGEGLSTPSALSFAALSPLAQFYSNHVLGVQENGGAPHGAGVESSDISDSFFADKTRARVSSYDVDPEGDETQSVLEGASPVEHRLSKARLSRKRSKSRSRDTAVKDDSDSDRHEDKERSQRRVKSRSKSCPSDRHICIDETEREQQVNLGCHVVFDVKKSEEGRSSQQLLQQQEKPKDKASHDGKTLMAVTDEERRMMLARRKTLIRQQQQQQQQSDQNGGGFEDRGCLISDKDCGNWVRPSESNGSLPSSSVDYCDVMSEPESDWSNHVNEAKLKDDSKRKEKEMKKIIKKYRQKTAKTEALLQHIDQLKHETDVIRNLYTQADKTTRVMRNEIREMKTKLAALCEQSISTIRKQTKAQKLEPMYYRRYLNVRCDNEATSLLASIRSRQTALSDLEVLVYRKHLLLSHALPGHEEELVNVKAPGNTKTSRKRFSDHHGLRGLGRGKTVTMEVVNLGADDAAPESTTQKSVAPLRPLSSSDTVALSALTPAYIGPQLPLSFRKLLAITAMSAHTGNVASLGGAGKTGTTTGGVAASQGLTTGGVAAEVVTTGGLTSDVTTTELIDLTGDDIEGQALGSALIADVHVDLDSLIDDDDSAIDESTPTLSMTPSLEATDL